MFDEKSDPAKPSIFSEILSLLSANFSQYFMFIALIVIMLIFTITTDGVFISSRNISNLLNQMGYIAVLAVGMTLVIVIRHIDLCGVSWRAFWAPLLPLR